MKSVNGTPKLSYKMYRLAFAVTLVLAVPAFSLRMTDMSQDIQTKVKEPQERAISLKLPLLQPIFHWTFMSREDLLSGKLLLRIIRDGQSSEIVIFEKGQLSDGWEAMPLPEGANNKGEIYFGFISTRKYLTAPADKLELELTVTKDLPGIGALQTGTLSAGKHISKGTYSGLTDEYDTTLLAKELAKEGKKTPTEQKELLDKIRQTYSHKAFLESWVSQWPLKITSEKGWLTDKEASVYKAILEKFDVKAKSPAGPTDSAVEKENPFQKYPWLWIAAILLVLFIIIFMRRVFGLPKK